MKVISSGKNCYFTRFLQFSKTSLFRYPKHCNGNRHRWKKALSLAAKMATLQRGITTAIEVPHST